VDWLEHFHRCLFFLDHLPLETRLHGDYHVTARPPMMNLLGAYFLAQAGDDFALFQVTFAFLNLLPYLACALIARRLVRGGARSIAILAILCAACPMVIENATYTWTKLLSAFFVILGLDLYLAAGSRKDAMRLLAAGLAFAAGIVVHYSAVPFAAFVAVHHLVVTARERSGWTATARASAASLLLLATWFGWAFRSYGLGPTLTSNTAVGDSKKLTAAGNVAKVFFNVVDTLVPHPLRAPSMEWFRQESDAGYARDYFFLMFQTNAIVAIGSIAGVLALAIAWRRLQAPTTPAGRFWRLFVPVTAVIAVATHGSADVFGVAHVVLQPLLLLGVTLVAAAWPTASRAVRTAVILGIVIDFALGVALHHEIETLENTAERTVFDPDASLLTDGTHFKLQWHPQGFLATWAWGNWYSKQVQPLLDRQIAAAHRLGAAHAAAAAEFLRQEKQRVVDLDARYWAGWFARHDGRVVFLGDRLAGLAALLRTTVLAAFAAMGWHLLKAWRVPPRVARARPAPARAAGGSRRRR
jgi:hypothetical protein